MQVTGTTSTSSNYAAASSNATTGIGNVDSSQFMKILLAELTHQNPLEPMDNTQMMSQFSQLNSLQELRDIHTQMNDMSTSSQTSYMAALIGKTIKAVPESGETVTGVVSSAIIDGGKYQLKVGDTTILLSDVTEIDGVKA